MLITSKYARNIESIFPIRSFFTLKNLINIYLYISFTIGFIKYAIKNAIIKSDAILRKLEI